jgi:hypothetical protein
MVRDETERHQMKSATDRSTDEPTSAAGEDTIEGHSLWPHQSDLDTRHSRISEAAYRLAEARGFESGSELDDWLAAERELDEAAQDGLMPHSKTTVAGSSSEASDSTTPGRPKETASRQQTRPEQDS